MILEYLNKNRHIQGHFSKEKKFIYMRITKNGGTSIGRNILQKEVKDYVVPLENKRKANNWFNEMTDDKLNDYFKFVIVRNPWDRAVSIWKYFTENTKSIPECSFEEFVEKDYFNYSRNLRMHSLCQNIYIEYNGERIVDYIARLENIDEDWKVISSKIGVSDKLPKSNSSNHEHYSTYYTEKEINRIAEIYEKDISILGYKFENLEDKNG
jgi:hypothetical protein